VAFGGWEMLAPRLGNPRVRAAAVAATAAVLLALGAASFAQTRVWRTADTLFAHSLRVVSHDRVMRQGIARCYQGAGASKTRSASSRGRASHDRDCARSRDRRSAGRRWSWRSTDRRIGFAFLDYDDECSSRGIALVNAGISADSVRAAFERRSAPLNWLPLMVLSDMAEATLFGVDPSAFHATNVALHALDAVLLFVLFRTLTVRAVAERNRRGAVRGASDARRVRGVGDVAARTCSPPHSDCSR
jgi:hypothetical protein